MKVVRLSALGTSRLYRPGNIPGTHFCQRLSQPQCHSAAGGIMSMKNSNGTIGNRTRDLPICSAVSQPTGSPCTPISLYKSPIFLLFFLSREALPSPFPELPTIFKFHISQTVYIRRTCGSPIQIQHSQWLTIYVQIIHFRLQVPSQIPFSW